jgi:hypothetical protein
MASKIENDYSCDNAEEDGDHGEPEEYRRYDDRDAH